MGDITTPDVTRKSAELVKTTNQPITIETLFVNPDVIRIPADESRESIALLPKPCFMRIDHGMTMISYDSRTDGWQEKSGEPIYYAVYLFQTESGEKRLITLPVAIFPLREAQGYNTDLLAEMQTQGMDVAEIRRVAPVNLVTDGPIGSYLDARYLASFRQILAGHRFITRKPNPEDSRDIQHSGWGRPHSSYELTIIGDPKAIIQTPINYMEQGIYRYVEWGAHSTYQTRVQVISDPIKDGKLSAFEEGILHAIARANTPK